MQQVFRREIKHQITLEKYSRLDHFFSQVLQKDPHNGTNGYLIRSLYFDTLQNRDYHEKEDGLDIRRKIRLRCYNQNTQNATIEMKQKQGVYQLKRSHKLTRADAEPLLLGNYESLLRQNTPFTTECYAIMTKDFYRPKVIIEYQRKAYIGKENNIRITFDREIRCSHRCASFLQGSGAFVPAFDPYAVIMEVKYDGFLPSYIKDVISATDVSAISAGKYNAGRYQTGGYYVTSI